MRLKSFFAATVEAALADGSRELGPEALIVQSRKAPPEARHLGAWEVVLADTGQAADREPQPASGSPVRETPIAREVGELRRQIEAMRRSIARSAAARPHWLAPSTASAGIFTALLEAEVQETLAQQIAERAASEPPGTAGLAAMREIEKRIAVDPRLGREGSAESVVALVGPPGSGKTTTLVKLAVTYGLTARRPVLLISADTCRIGAADQLRCYAGLMGVGFELAETNRALDQSLGMHRSKGLILIDTPGFAASEMDQAGDLARFLAGRNDIDIQLVLSASMKSADITRAVDRFEIFHPAKLLFSSLDETEQPGAILNEAVRTGKPVSFLASGQQIPEDLEAASAGRIAALILPEAIREAVAAA